MQGVTTTTRAVFFHFQSPGLIAPIFACEIIPFFAFGAGQCDKHAISFFSHSVTYLFLGIKA
jgi:hypothetical protein